MEQPIAQQALGFAAAMALGGALGLLYDALRGLRRSLRLLTALLDALFCAAVLAANLLFALCAGGEFRLSSLFAEFLGAALWFLLPSRLFLPASIAFWRVLTFPARAVGRLVKLFSKKSRIFLKNLFSKHKKSVTMRKEQKLRNTTGGFFDAPAQISTHYKIGTAGSGSLRHHADRQASSAD